MVIRHVYDMYQGKSGRFTMDIDVVGTGLSRRQAAGARENMGGLDEVSERCKRCGYGRDRV